MSHTHTPQLSDSEKRDLTGVGGSWSFLSAIAGIIFLVAGLVVGFFAAGTQGLALSYLTGFSVFLTISLGGLFFVLIHHLSRAGWSTSVRRLAELFAANLQLMAVLAIPVIVFMYLGWLYHEWADPTLYAKLHDHKQFWLEPNFFTARIVLYFVVWIALARWVWKRSLRQDHDGDVAHTLNLQGYSGLGVALFALTANFAYMDLFMSLDPHWYSTIYGVYVFSGGYMAFYATMIVILRLFQAKGIMTESVNTEHYHDLGKWLFGFVFFWTYIAYSQYMLQWYGNIPEETQWYARRGAETSEYFFSGAWGHITLLLLFGHFVFPFPALLSRWVKRRLTAFFLFLALWLILMHAVDMAWLIMPEARAIHGIDATLAQLSDTGEIINPVSTTSVYLAVLAAILCTAGVGGLWFASLVRLAGADSLVPTSDPRISEALAFHNM